MFRGNIKFKCTHCENVFKAPDLEYNCTALSVPQPCLNCGSRRTLPQQAIVKILWFAPSYGVYRQIWNTYENKQHTNDGKE